MLEEKVFNDYKEALKGKDSVKSSILSFLRAQFMNLAVEKKKTKLEDGDCVTVIKKLVKQHQDSIEQFTKGVRLDLADKEAKELQILKAYLPEELSSDEINKVIEEVIRETQAQGAKDMSRVMKEVMNKVSGKADNKLVSDSVRKRLSQ
ncbi:MAG: GatB/YqeY domain-containing protein [Candidatus Omnitrophota bacterium]|nr:GatB/YqeY domain-containing protein [Candidatus Omnitrophota bacterium]